MILALVLSWSLVEADCNEVPEVIDHYVVRVAEIGASGAPEVFAPAATTMETTWTDSSADPPVGSVRIYKVVAVDQAGNTSEECQR